MLKMKQKLVGSMNMNEGGDFEEVSTDEDDREELLQQEQENK